MWLSLSCTPYGLIRGSLNSLWGVHHKIDNSTPGKWRGTLEHDAGFWRQWGVLYLSYTLYGLMRLSLGSLKVKRCSCLYLVHWMDVYGVLTTILKEREDKENSKTFSLEDKKKRVKLNWLRDLKPKKKLQTTLYQWIRAYTEKKNYKVLSKCELGLIVKTLTKKKIIMKNTILTTYRQRKFQTHLSL